MKLINYLEEIKGLKEKPVKGLYDAKVGDRLKIGVQGERSKDTHVLIKKVLPTNRLQTERGDIFDRNGMIHTRKSSYFKSLKKEDRIVFAQHMTADEVKKKQIKSAHSLLSDLILKKELSVQQIKAIGKIINVNFGNLDDYDE
jgi:hypothetical protein